MTEQPEALDDLADTFCYELALVLWRILDLAEEETEDDEGLND